MVIPDTLAHLDGHSILTFTYSVFLNKGDGNPRPGLSKESTLHLGEITDPDYYGYITFEKPGRQYAYTADGALELTADEITELIKHISHVRDNPAGWKYLA